MSDITLVNLNMLFVRYSDTYDKELHLPLGLLYLTTVLEDAGFDVDFRDYQMCPADDPFDLDVFVDFLADSAPIIGLSCMANLLPFTILAARRLKERYPDHTIVLGGVGAKAVEEKVLNRFPWIDLIAHGEAERAVVPLVEALGNGGDVSDVPGVFYRKKDGQIACNPPPARIDKLDTIPRPAYHKVDLAAYDAYGMVSSRGCPYKCSFCSVAPVWNHKCHFRSGEDVVAEMKELHEAAGVELFLFQDEFFVSSKKAVMRFCDALKKSELKVRWKAFARVDIADQELMEAMVGTGCLEIRFGIETGSERMLEHTHKGFTPDMAVDVVSRATQLFPRVDTFFVWGYPDETMDDFYLSLFQMISFRLMGARILPSLLCLLPQTELFRSLTPEQLGRLEFCEELLPEYVITGHEVCRVGSISIADKHRTFFDFIRENKDIFPGFFLIDVEENIRPKLSVLQEHGFYTRANRELTDLDSCGAHSPRV
ncbi:MAG: B12-binding domain-containing radical SAM protein [Deltaproteobacteria bacterium]|nr:B12-binding domain-containing radical SAM protein [Deltaproteobacteria bacterium]